MKASIDSIETFGLVDGPGIRTVIFFNGCLLRCKYCHNPEMWKRGHDNYTVQELYDKIMRSKPYFGKNGGVTFSGGEPLLQPEFLISICKKLKENNIHICLDTAGVGLGNYDELLSYIDIVLLDIKHTHKDEYEKLTGQPMEKVEEFIEALNRNNKKIWVRQVIVPGITDSECYMNFLNEYLKKIKNIERIDFLPFHRLGREKYLKLGIPYPYEEKKEMDKDKCNELYAYFMEKYKNSKGKD